MAASARTHLPKDVTVQQLTVICRAIEKSIAGSVSKKSRLGANLGEMKLLAAFRLNGDEAIDALGPHGEKLDVAYAAYALWKLVDACESNSNGDAPEIFWLAADANLTLASTALQICSYIRATLNERTQNYRELFTWQSTKAKESVRFRWKSRDEHLRFALSLAPSFHATSRAEVARQLADAIFDKFKKRYTDDTVDKWLKTAEWSAPAEGVSTP
jgi:hypothetical protein